MESDRFPEAKQSLLRLPSPWAGAAGGSSTGWESASTLAGNIQAALAAWARVDPHSTWSVQAGLARARTLVGDLGRFSDAETLLERLMRDPGAARDEVRHTLSELYFWEGRRGAMRRLLERDYRLAADPVLELRDHWRIDNAVTLLEKVRCGGGPGHHGWHRMTTGSGWRGRAWRRKPADSPRPWAGSTAAWSGGPLIRPSGEPGSTGRAPPATWPKRAVPWRLFPPKSSPRANGSTCAAGWRPESATPRPSATRSNGW